MPIEYFADLGQVFAKLVLKSPGSKCRNIVCSVLVIQHHFQASQTAIGNHQISQWLHSCYVDVIHLVVSGLHVFNIQLVPLLQQLYQVLLPLVVAIDRALLLLGLRPQLVVNLDETLLAVGHICVGCIGDLIGDTVDLLSVRILLINWREKHRSDVFLLNFYTQKSISKAIDV